MNQPFPGLPAGDNAPRARSHPMRGLGRVVVILIALFIGWHVVPALTARDNPPLACQVDGGHWDPWNGWTCS